QDKGSKGCISPAREAAEKIKTKGVSARRITKIEEEDALRHHKAISKIIARAEKEAEQRKGEGSPGERELEISCVWPAKQPSLCSEHDDNIAVAQEISLQSGSQWEQMAKRLKVLPEATFTPTVAGLRTRENQDLEFMDQM
ncbi:hypothetical protein E2320_001400, partial [Naja naja]